VEKKYCATIQREISLLVSGRSVSEDGLGNKKIAQHIAACDSCARHFQQMRQISGELRSVSARMPKVEITPGFRRRLMESVSESNPAWFGIKPAWAALVPVAACLFLALTLWPHSSVQKDFSAASSLAVSLNDVDDSEEAFLPSQIFATAGGDDFLEGDLESYPRRPSRSYLGTYSEIM
jgi:hypothetical protein